MELHKRLHDFETFDEIKISIVPRFKTSGMSGDEWRQSAQIDFFFKGELILSESYTTLQAALAFLPGLFLQKQSPIPDQVLAMEKILCDQPSCKKRAVVKYRLIRQTDTSGHFLDPSDQHGEHHRRFCEDHMKRGNSDREDCDKNYKPIQGAPPSEGVVKTDMISPSGFGGYFKLGDSR